MNVFIYGPITADPERSIDQGDRNKTARSIQITADYLLGYWSDSVFPDEM